MSGQRDPNDSIDPAKIDEIATQALHHQGEMWCRLLTGEQAGDQLLDARACVGAAASLLANGRRLAFYYLWKWSWAILLAATADTSFASSAVALVTFLVAHRVVAILRRHSRVVRLIGHPPRVLVARGELQGGELARAGLTAADVYALLRENGAGDLGQVGYLLYEPRGAVTLIGADSEPARWCGTGLELLDTVERTPGKAGSAVTESQCTQGQ